MAAARNPAELVGAEVTSVLNEAKVTAAEVLAEAERRADRAGRDDLAKLRGSVEEQIAALGDARARLKKIGNATMPRLREAASQLTELPARLVAAERGPGGESPFDSAIAAAQAAGRNGQPSHLVALMKAADTIAEDLVQAARKQADQLEQAARREAERIAAKEPERVAGAYDPAARRAEALRREVGAVNALIGPDEDAGEGREA